MSKPDLRIIPARPATREESTSFLPRVPWRIVLLASLSVLLVVGGYTWKEQRKALELRAQILRVHEDELAEARTAYIAMRDKLDGLILAAATGPTETQVDHRLNIPGLRSGNGLYLRLPLAQAMSKSDVAESAKSAAGDRIASCLGLAPTSARGLYEKGEFLLPSFLDDVKDETNVMKLRVQDQMLSTRIRADLPSVLGQLRADWFMLVLQEGDNRRDAPVRVFLWDLAHGDLLLRARVKSQGVLLTSHILSQATPTKTPIPERERTAGAANDCSIAAQLKQLSAASQ